MANDLNGILDDAGDRALVEKYLEKKFLERQEYGTSLANSSDAMELTIPSKSAIYVEATRKGRFRMPEHVSASALTSDPASGASMSVEKVKFPMEFIHEYVPVSTITEMVSWIDLEAWANEDLPEALQRRMHQLTQNAFKVGRFQPGKWASDGTADTAFDTTVQRTSVSMYGLTWTFVKAPSYFANGAQQFADLKTDTRITWADFERVHNGMALAGTPKINGRFVAHISESIKSDLMEDDKYFRAAVEAFKGDGLKDNTILEYRGWRFKIDDEPFTEDFAAPNVRASNGRIHTAICYGRGAFAYTRLGGKSSLRPTFKIQDISKTGKEKTIGYTIPFQVGIVDAARCATITGPVTNWLPNNSD